MNNMVNNQTTLSSFERLKQWPGARYLDNDFLLVESPGKAPFPGLGLLGKQEWEAP